MKDHDHDHDHHHHDHKHDHGHHHDHDHAAEEQSLLARQKRVDPSAPAATPEPVITEDAGSQALSDALRSSFSIVKFIMVLLVLVFFASGIFTVPSQEKAIVLRFGRPVGTGEDQLLGPGLHWSFPYPIDEIVRIPIGEIQTVTSKTGWYAISPEEEQAGVEPQGNPTLNPAVEGYTITADGNILHVKTTLRYRIAQPLNYVLNFVNASNVVQSALDNAVYFASAHFKVDEALYFNRLAYQEKVLSRLRELVDEKKLGITIEQADLQIVAPLFLKNVFSQVLVAQIERRKAVDDANAYANRILSTAQGEAAGLVNEGKTSRTRLLQGVQSEARYFEDQLEHYQKNPELFKARLLAEYMTRIMKNVDEKWFLPVDADGKLRIDINRFPRSIKQPGQEPQQR